MSKDDNMEIMSEANLTSFRNIEEMTRGKEESMPELIATIGCLVSVVV